MDSLPDLQQQNTDEGVRGHCPAQLPAVLPKVQEGVRHQRRTTENASEQRARRLNAEPASNDETIAEAGSFYEGGSLTIYTVQ